MTRAPGILGLVFGGFIGSWPFLIAAFFYWGMQETPDFNEDDLNFIWIAFLLFGLVCFIPSGYVIHRSLLLLFGKKRIHLDERRLSLITQLGPFRHTRSIHLDQLIGFQIETAQGVGPAMLQSYASLFTIRPSGKRLILLRAFPSDYLQQLVEQLEQHIARLTQRDFSRLQTTSTTQPIRTETVSLNPNSVAPRKSPPLGSNLDCRQSSNGIVIDIPGLGLKKTTEGGGGLFLGFLIVGEAFILFGLIPALLLGKVEGQPMAGWIIATVFTFITAGIIILVINAATRRGQILWENQSLTLTERDMWGKHESSWTESQIKTIDVGVSEQTSDGETTWTYFLKISPESGAQRHWFSNRSKEEIEWVVTTLKAKVTPS